MGSEAQLALMQTPMHGSRMTGHGEAGKRELVLVCHQHIHKSVSVSASNS